MQFPESLAAHSHLSLFLPICRCNRAAALIFRIKKRLISANRSLKRVSSQTIVSFFHETVSNGPEKWLNGGLNRLRWMHPRIPLPILGCTVHIKAGKIFNIYSTGFFFSAATSSWTPASTSRISSTSTGEWMYRVGGLMVVLGIPPLVR